MKVIGGKKKGAWAKFADGVIVRLPIEVMGKNELELLDRAKRARTTSVWEGEHQESATRLRVCRRQDRLGIVALYAATDKGDKMLCMQSCGKFDDPVMEDTFVKAEQVVVAVAKLYASGEVYHKKRVSKTRSTLKQKKGPARQHIQAEGLGLEGPVPGSQETEGADDPEAPGRRDGAGGQG